MKVDLSQLRAVCASAAFVFVLLIAAGCSSSRNLEVSIDEDFVRESVESVGDVISREYFDPEVGLQVDAYLREQLVEGQYADANTPELLAELLTRDLHEVTGDLHLAVGVVPDAVSDETPDQVVGDEPRAVVARRSNFGIQRVEILGGNVGYLNLTSFFRPEEARESIATAMQTLQFADALILDMRANVGGSPGTVAILVSYLFETPELPLFEIVHRPEFDADEYVTEGPGLVGRNGTRSVYVLTSEGTYSAGEGLAFLLQERQRAEIIGETTAGAANPGRPYRINPRFNVTVPNGQVRSAVGGGNWEGVGVVPDVQVPAEEALRIAHIRALRDLLENTPAGSWHDRLERELNRLE